MDTALSAATSLLYPKGLENVVLASRARHAETVEAAHEAGDAYLKRVRRPPVARFTALGMRSRSASLLGALATAWAQTRQVPRERDMAGGSAVRLCLSSPACPPTCQRLLHTAYSPEPCTPQT